MGKIIKYILSFILMICIMASIIIGIVANTVANKEFFLAKLEEIDFYNKTSEKINDTFKNYILQSGMEETVFENIYSNEKLKQDINMLVDAIYENKEINIETESIKTKLTENIDNYLNQNNLKVNNRTEIDTFINTIINTYKNGVVFSSSMLEQVTPITTKVIGLIHRYQPIVYMVTAFLAIILILSNLKDKTDILKYIGISMFTSGILLVITKIFINSKIKIDGITIINDIFSNLIHNIANQILNYIFYFGIGILIVGLIAIIIKIVSIKDEEKDIDKHENKRRKKSKH